jgi:hypothetical protein
VALRYAGRWLFCFLAGPVVFVAAAVIYWVHCGDPDLLDQVILAECGVLAVGYWLLAILAATRTDRFLDANPVRVAELARRLGARAAVAVLLACVLVFLHGRWVLAGIEATHRIGFVGWLVLTVSWSSALACGAFLLRLVGLWCHDYAPVKPQT